MLDKVSTTTGLAAVGLTKRGFARVVLASIVRRLLITDYENSDRYDTPAREVARLLSDRAAMSMYKEIGKKLEGFVLNRGSLYDLVMGLADEHVATLGLIGERIEEGDKLIVDDELVETFMGDVVNFIRQQFIEPPQEGAQSKGRPLTSSVVEGLRRITQSLTIHDVYPDISQYLKVRSDTPVLGDPLAQYFD
jgi:hypothetical protein